MSVFKPDFIRDEIEDRISENDEAELLPLLNVSDEAIDGAFDSVVNDFDWQILDDIRARIIAALSAAKPGGAYDALMAEC